MITFNNLASSRIHQRDAADIIGNLKPVVFLATGVQLLIHLFCETLAVLLKFNFVPVYFNDLETFHDISFANDTAGNYGGPKIMMAIRKNQSFILFLGGGLSFS